jgi:hypothetical protein
MLRCYKQGIRLELSQFRMGGYEEKSSVGRGLPFREDLSMEAEE